MKKYNFILPLYKQFESATSDLEGKKIAVIVHLYYLDTIPNYLKYVENIPNYIDIFFTVSEENVKAKIMRSRIFERANCKIIEKKNRGRDISALLVACRNIVLNYEYICFIHDKKERTLETKKDIEKWVKCLWENTLGSGEYIENVLNIFHKNHQMGLLVPPSIISERNSAGYINTWHKNFLLTQKLIQKMDLKCDIDIDRSPITLGSVFWARVIALKKLFELDWTYEDFDEEPLKVDGTISHAIERVFAFVAQDAGYETGWIMTERYANEEFDYMINILEKSFDRLKKSLGIEYIFELDNYENKKNELIEFVSRYEKIYIYGAGVYGKKCFLMLKDIRYTPNAFLVSNSKENPLNIENVPVYQFSKVELNFRCGIIIAAKYYDDILKIIRNKNENFFNIYLFNKD